MYIFIISNLNNYFNIITLLCKQSSPSEATLLVRRRTLLKTSSKYSKNGDKKRSVKQSSSSSKQSCFRGRTLLEFACKSD